MKMFAVKFDYIVGNGLSVLIAQFVYFIDCVHLLEEAFFHFFNSDFHMIWGKDHLVGKVLFLRVKYSDKGVSFTDSLTWSEDHLEVELRQNV